MSTNQIQPAHATTTTTTSTITPTSPPTITIIVPALNEARNLEVVLPMLPPVHEVILVDGHSVDDTIEVARRVLPQITVVSQTRRGKGNALACGFLAATGDIIVMFDADGSADPAEIPRYVQTLIDGADFAKGSRFRQGGGSHDITVLRRLGNSCLNLVTNTLLRTDFTDLCYGYNAFWRRIVPILDLPHPDLPPDPGKDRRWGDGFEIETLINYRVSAHGLIVREVPSVEQPRVYGESNLNAFTDGIRVVRTMAAEHRRARAMRRRAGAWTADDVRALSGKVARG